MGRLQARAEQLFHLEQVDEPQALVLLFAYVSDLHTAAKTDSCIVHPERPDCHKGHYYVVSILCLEYQNSDWAGGHFGDYILGFYYQVMASPWGRLFLKLEMRACLRSLTA